MGAGPVSPRCRVTSALDEAPHVDHHPPPVVTPKLPTVTVLVTPSWHDRNDPAARLSRRRHWAAHGGIMKTAHVNNVKLEYEVVGSGEPVLLINPVLADGFLPLLS